MRVVELVVASFSGEFSANYRQRLIARKQLAIPDANER